MKAQKEATVSEVVRLESGEVWLIANVPASCTVAGGRVPYHGSDACSEPDFRCLRRLHLQAVVRLKLT
jgi:hypothetical protein